MSTAPKTPRLEPLDERYDIVAELGSPDATQSFIAKRRADGADVLITVARTPEGDDGDALTHLAADARLLVGLSHPALIPVLDGIWLGQDAFAVVTRRVVEPTLSERLARGEELSNPRIAEVLQELNGLLVWAREQKLVHRFIRPGTVVLARGTGRAMASFAMAPGPHPRLVDADADAKTIAELAWTLLTRTAPPAKPNTVLATLRPDLPQRVIEETGAILWSERHEASPDVLAYLATIAMADPLMVGETSAAQVHSESLEEQRKAREQLEAERQALETETREEREHIAQERALFEQTTAAQREAFERSIAQWRDEFERASTKERSELQRAAKKEREALEKERGQLERRFTQERELLENDRGQLERRVTQERESLEGQRQRLAAEASELEALRAAELYVEEPVPDDLTETSAAETSGTEAPRTEATRAEGSAEELSFQAEQRADDAALVELESLAAAAPLEDTWDNAPRSRKSQWVLAGSAVVLAGIIITSATRIVRHRDTTFYPLLPLPTRGTTPVVVDSSGGSVVSHGAPPGTLASPDSLRDTARVPAAHDTVSHAVAPSHGSGSAAHSDADHASTPTHRETRRPVQDSGVAHVDTGTSDSGGPPSGTLIRTDTGVRRDTVRRDSVTHRDTLTRPKPDTGWKGPDA